MSRRAPNHQLAVLLSQARWRPADLARAVNALGAVQGVALRYDRTTVAHWLAGSRPRAPVPDLAAQALSDRIARLVTPEDTGLAPPRKDGTPPPLTPWAKGEPVRHLLALCGADADPERRAFLQRSVYGLAAVPALTWSPAAPPRERSPRHTEAADAAALQAMTHTFAALAQQHGGAPVRTALAAYLADHASRLIAAPASPEARRQTVTGTAQLTHLLADMTADAGHPGLAQRYFRTALALAHQVPDRRLYAITLRAMSTQALRLGHPQHALHLAETAVDIARPVNDPATNAFLYAQRALTHARTRQPRAALADLAAAERHNGAATSPPGPFSAYPRAALDYQRAQTLHVLGEPAQALAALKAAADHRTPAERKSYALTQAQLAEALLELGHLEAACAHVHLFLDHYPHLRSSQVEQALTQLLQGLARFPRQRHAAEAAERARTVARPLHRA
ncbi:tetratricopeptide repeat protein [Streptomyces sp. NPDC050504]|uniref:tetratricopeptide repeat protein n=1 Tax=Streptomyces sp. NPDC050504 TaxID=3365618 RepID=UPI00379EB99A